MRERPGTSASAPQPKRCPRSIHSDCFWPSPPFLLCCPNHPNDSHGHQELPQGYLAPTVRTTGSLPRLPNMFCLLQQCTPNVMLITYAQDGNCPRPAAGKHAATSCPIATQRRSIAATPLLLLLNRPDRSLPPKTPKNSTTPTPTKKFKHPNSPKTPKLQNSKSLKTQQSTTEHDETQ